MVVPYIAKSTEVALRQVPDNYREGAEALGMSKGYSLRKIVLRSGARGSSPACCIALAIAGGETAPLIYTAGLVHPAAQSPNCCTSRSAYLTYPVWAFYQLPSAQARALSYDAALLLVVLVVLLLVTARLIVVRTQRHREA